MATKSIGIDIRETAGNPTGKGRYTEEITRAMIKAAPDTKFYLFNSEPNEKFPAEMQVSLPARGLMWHFAVRRHLLKNPVDFYFSSTSFIYPAIAPRTQKLGIVVHDLVAFLHPKNHHWFPVLVERLTLGLAIKKTAFITTISQSTWNDLTRLKPAAAAKKVVFAPPAVSENFINTENKTLELPEKFILTVGTLEPRKNIPSLMKAFENIAEKHPDLHLCIAGGIGWKTSGIKNAVPEKLTTRIHFLGYVDYSKLAELYSRATIFAYPSLYEGFGIPPLEAMACGTPVLTSNISSLPEVVGDAAYLVNPLNISEIETGIEELLKNPETYRTKGLERAKLFSWEKSAKEILINI